MTRKILTVAAMAFAMGVGSAQAEGDAAAGAKVFKKCKACHKVEEGKKSPIGPNLFGVVGREAGTGDFKRYSKAMKDSGVTWDEESLAGYLAAPRKFMPKNKMAFPGLKKEKDIANVIAYLKTLK